MQTRIWYRWVLAFKNGRAVVVRLEHLLDLPLIHAESVLEGRAYWFGALCRAWCSWYSEIYRDVTVRVRDSVLFCLRGWGTVPLSNKLVFGMRGNGWIL